VTVSTMRPHVPRPSSLVKIPATGLSNGIDRDAFGTPTLNT
jgi:hypothetical protein